MRLIIVSDSFSDEETQILRNIKHKVTTPRSIDKAQKILDKALKKKENVPEAVIVDHSLKGAQFFAKSLQVSIQDGGEETGIYLAVKRDVIKAIDPDYFGISGFIEAPLTAKKIIDVLGIPEAEEEPPEEPVQELEVHEDQAEEAAAEIPVEKETRTTRPEHVEDAPATSSLNDESPEKKKKNANVYKLAFSGVLGIVVILASIVGVSAFRSGPSAPVRDLPNFYGMAEAEAVELASSYGLDCDIEYAPSDSDECIVLSQYPPAGTPIECFEEVALVVSGNSDNEQGQEVVQETEEANTPDSFDPDESGGYLDTPPSQEGDTLPVDQLSPAPQPSPAPAPAPQPSPAPASGSAPVARISASSTSVPTGGFVTFTASGSYDPDGGYLTYTWSCGGSGPSVSREMVSNVVPGSVTVTVTVTDSEGKSSSASISVSVY